MNKYLLAGWCVIAIIFTVIFSIACLVFAFKTEPNVALAVILASTLLSMDVMMIDYINRIEGDE